MNEKPRDDLTVIKGIGPVWQRRLQASLGIYTFQDLAALSSDEILSSLKPAPAKSDCESWIRQAQALVKTTESSKFEIEESGNQTAAPTESSNWKPVASFVVEFLNRTAEGEIEQRQTKVQHIETDTNASWPGIENVALCRWILEQMGETAFTGLDQQGEEIRARAQQEIEQELELQRATAEQELQNRLEENQARAHQALQKKLIEEQAKMHNELEQERNQARQAWQQELDSKQIQTQLELEQELDEERARARQALQQELDEERGRVRNELERERNQARQALQQELDSKQAQIEQELEQALNTERAQAQQALQQELDEERNRILNELERERIQARLALQRELDEEHLSRQQSTLEQEVVAELQPEEKVRPATQTSEHRPVRELLYDVLAITQLRAFQPGDAGEPIGIGIPGQPFSGFINGDELLTFVIDFEIAESIMSEVAQQDMTYQAQLYARDLLTGEKKHLGNTAANPLVEGRSSYSARLADVTLERGVYEVTVLVTVHNRQPRANYLMVPFLQVA